MDDVQLLRAARDDPAAFAEFYRRHRGAILTFFMRRTGDAELALDLTAESFAAALESLPRFRWQRRPPAAWLFAIARNKWIDSLRRGTVEAEARRRLGMRPLQLSDGAVERIQDAVSDDRLIASLEALPQQSREALIGRVVEDMSYRELAERLQCSEQVVRKRVSRSLAVLRADLGDKR